MEGIVPRDPRTRLAVKASYLKTALDALNRAIAMEDDGASRRTLSLTAADVAERLDLAHAEWDKRHEREAALIAAALEG